MQNYREIQQKWHSEQMPNTHSVNITSEATEEVYLITSQRFQLNEKLKFYFSKMFSHIIHCTFPWKWSYNFNWTELSTKHTTNIK